MDKATEAAQLQEPLPPSYTEATTTGPPQEGYGKLPGQYPQDPNVQHVGYPSYPNYPVAGYPQGQQFTTQYTVPGQPGYVYSNVVVAQPLVVPASGPPPPDHMCGAIFVTLCCFWPTGILAILKASDSKNAYARGDMLGAKESAKSAKRMINISILIGIISIILLCVLIGVYMSFILNLNNYD